MPHLPLDRLPCKVSGKKHLWRIRKDPSKDPVLRHFGQPYCLHCNSTLDRAFWAFFCTAREVEEDNPYTNERA